MENIRRSRGGNRGPDPLLLGTRVRGRGRLRGSARVRAVYG